MPFDDRDSFGVRDPAETAAGREPDSVNAMQQQLDELSAQLQRLTGESANGKAPRGGSNRHEAPHEIESRFADSAGPQASALSVQQLSETLRRVDSRLDHLVGTSRATSDQLEQRMAAVDRVLCRLASRDPASPREAAPTQPAPALGGFDAAVEEILARQRALDADEDRSEGADQPEAELARGNREPPWPPAGQRLPFADLQDHLRALTSELQSLRGPGGFEDAVRGMRGDLAAIGRALTEAAPREALRALEADVRTLGSRLEHTRQQGADSPALAGLEQGLAHIRETLRAFAPAESLAAFREDVQALDRKVEMLALQGSDERGLAQLERSVAELREIASHAASADALAELSRQVQQIAAQLERWGDPAHFGTEIVSKLDRRFELLTAGLQAHDAGSAAAMPERFVSVVEALANKLDQVELNTQSAPALDAIASQMTRLSERLEAWSPGAQSLEHVERSFADLLDRLDGLREEAVAAAENAARGLLGRYDVPALDSLKQDMDLLRESQAEGERRTQATLQGMHETLERLVSRLAQIEGEGRLSVALPLEQRLELSDPGLASPLVPDLGPPELPRRTASATPAPATIAPERRPIDPSLPADHPLEPGAARARASAPSAAQRIAASEAALGSAKPVSERDAKANFIAAARRAAQAAAGMSAPNAAEASTAESSGASGAVAQSLARRGPLLLGLAILGIAGTLHLVINVIGAETRRAAMPPAASSVAVAIAPAPAGQKQEAAGPGAAPAGGTLAVDIPAVPVEKAEALKLAERELPAPPPATTALPTTSSDLKEPGSEPTPPAAPAASAAPAAAPPPVSAALGSASAPAAAPAPTSGVSPLTIASMQLPAGDATGSIGRGTARQGIPVPFTSPGSSAAQGAGGIPTALRAAAAAGNPAAEYEMGVRYAEGRGSVASLEEAARWFERAAAQQLAPAQYRLGSLYEKGQGVKKDLERARQLYRAAAEKGHGKAMHNLAVLHAEGVDGKPDFAEASRWFRKGAQRGIADSQYNLGILYARGLGVQQDLIESYKWFALAARQGDADAGKKRDDIATRLDQRSIAAANLAVQTFTAEPQPEEAITVRPPPGGWEASSPTSGTAKPRTAATGGQRRLVR